MTSQPIEDEARNLIEQAVKKICIADDREAKKDLQEIGKPAVPAVIALLQEDNPDIRLRAVEVLSHIKDESSVDALIQLINDKNRKVREAAIWALGALQSEKAVGPLINLINNWKVQASSIDPLDRDEEYYNSTFAASSAVHALGAIGGELALTFLEGTSQMKGLVYDVIVTAAKEEVNAIQRKLGGKPDLRDLLYVVKDSGLHEKFPKVWMNAINELADTGDESVLADLETLKGKIQNEDKRAVLEAIEKIRGRMQLN